MFTIEVDLDVYQRLTSRLTSTEDSYNDVIRRLLDSERSSGDSVNGLRDENAWIVKGNIFPEGTQFRGTYLKKTFYAEVVKGSLLLSGTSYESPSAAASSITGSPTNGWKFWYYKMPGGVRWRKLDALPRQNAHRR